MKKKTVRTLVTALLMVALFAPALPLHAQNNSDTLLLQGLEAYRNGDWTTALFFLRKAATMPENITAETWYVLIMSEVFSGDYQSVLTDGAYFLQKFSDFNYVAQVKYQMARSEYLLERYTDAVRDFTAFCNTYPTHELVPSALFWMAECLYQTFNFDPAKALFQRIVAEYPQSSKVVEATFRLELLKQREREEKLLYLLRVTGEEYLASREEYERLLKQYQSEEDMVLRSRIRDRDATIQDLELALEASQAENDRLQEQLAVILYQNKELKTAAEDAMAAVSMTAEMSRIQSLQRAEEDSSVPLNADGVPFGSASLATGIMQMQENYQKQLEIERLLQKAKKLREVLEEAPAGQAAEAEAAPVEEGEVQ